MHFPRASFCSCSDATRRRSSKMSILPDVDSVCVLNGRVESPAERSDLPGDERSVYFPRSPQGATGFGTGVFAIFEHLHTVDEHVFHATCVLMRFLERGAIGD